MQWCLILRAKITCSKSDSLSSLDSPWEPCRCPHTFSSWKHDRQRAASQGTDPCSRTVQLPCVCVFVCVWERERESIPLCVYVCVCTCACMCVCLCIAERTLESERARAPVRPDTHHGRLFFVAILFAHDLGLLAKLLLVGLVRLLLAIAALFGGLDLRLQTAAEL